MPTNLVFRVRERTQLVKALVVKPGDLSSSLTMHMVEGDELHKLSPDLYRHYGMQQPPSPNTLYWCDFKKDKNELGGKGLFIYFCYSLFTIQGS